MKSLLFDPVIQKWFDSTFAAPSPPQNMGWPKISAGENTLIFAPTGSGKTLAAFLWCINDIFLQLKDATDTKNSQIHTLYISPLKALNNDIERNLRQPIKGIWDLANSMDLKVGLPKVSVRTGDTPSHVRQTMLKSPPHILITTPESLYLMITSQRGRQIFKHLRYLIVDEIHAVSNNKRGVHLSLSLERLETIVTHSPVRIGLSATQKPLNKIAAYLGGLSYSKKTKRYEDRPVSIVDCGQKKELDIQIISPVKEFSDLPDATVWPNVIEQCYKLICDHKTTLIFANMRAQTEKMVRQLNELHRDSTGDNSAEIALAHHGSMSREMRFNVEERLKLGKIPAVVATASLELGIDIGSIDLVIHLESPRSISGSIQRIGRSGHLITSKSKGRIIPMFPADLDDAAALTKGVVTGELEETHIPENCLDVLSQQILAEVSMNPIKRDDLLHICRSSYCYRNLSEIAFNNTLQMLEGRFANSKLPALQPAIVWDRVNQMISPRRAARMISVLNGGTIPDRGYFSVVLGDQNQRLGEVEEEFVFESRVGDIFHLGNTEWRITNITNDRIIVNPVNSIKPRAPFWKGEIPYRNYETSYKTSEFRHILEERIDKETTGQWLTKNYHLDMNTANSLLVFLRKQKSLTGYLPTNRRIIAEWFYDSANELNLIIHAGFGARVTGLWVIAVASLLETFYKTEVQYTFNDDGFLIRLQNLNEKPPIDYILNQSFKKVKEIVLSAISTSPVFSIQFRYNATRALLLPRSRQGKRIPLWLQRLRAADLLQATRQYEDFPILLETYRSCLYDVFDMNALEKVISNIQDKKVQIHHVQTPYPSPMASGLIFNFITYQMYDYDRSRAPADAASISSEVLSQIISREEIPAIIDPETIGKAEQRWQFLLPENKARDAEELFLIIQKLEPISQEDLSARCTGELESHLEKLREDKRIFKNQKGENQWITAEYVKISESSPKHEIIYHLVNNYTEVHGPVLPDEISTDLHLPVDLVIEALKKLTDKKVLIYGQMVKNRDEFFWCNKYNFAELYRQAISIRRKKTTALNRTDFYKFLFKWHIENKNITDILYQYQFLPFDTQLFERELLRARKCTDSVSNLPVIRDEISMELINGNYILRYAPGTTKIFFHRRGEGGFVIAEQSDGPLDENENSILDFLHENGASIISDLEAGLDKDRYQLTTELRSLAMKGRITCDNYHVMVFPEKTAGKHDKNSIRRQVYSRVKQNADIESTRWFHISAFSVLGKKRAITDQAEFQARMLLQRFGILVKEWYRRESGLLPWIDIFQALKRLEWQGEIRRGYFVSDLSGIQFASHQAVELLENMDHVEENYHLLSVLDPALPFGPRFTWNLQTLSGQEVNVTRSPVNHILFLSTKPIAYLENFAEKIWLMEAYNSESAGQIAQAIKIWLMMPEGLRPKRKIEIKKINGDPAIDSPLTKVFLRLGFESDQKKLVLWPSGV